MTHVKLRIIMLALILLTVLFVPRTLAQESPSQSESEIAAQRCSLSQNYLNNIQKPRDLRARVDRLQAYRYIYQRFDIFTKRLERNKQPEAQNIRATLADFNLNIESFKTSYEQYDQAREEVVKVSNCKNNMNVFQQKLDNARSKRSMVNQSVMAIEEMMNPKLKIQLETLYQGLLATGTTRSSNE